MLRFSTTVVFVSVIACSGGSGTAPKGGDGGEELPTPDPPCVGESWGSISDWASSVHVREDGDDESGDGSAGAPVATLSVALDLARASDELTAIAIGPGTFESGLILGGEGLLSEDYSDDGLSIEGCGWEETTLEEETSDQSLIWVTGATGMRIAGLTLEGGRRSLWIWGGAEVVVEGVAIQNSIRVAVVVADHGTEVSFTDVQVTDVVSEDSALGSTLGYGISVQNASVMLVGTTVTGATGVGFLASNAQVEMTDVTVQETARGAGDLYGRGIQFQEQCTATLTGVDILNNADAGLFSLQSASLDMDGLFVDQVIWSSVPDADDTSGDGIVVTGADDEHNYDPAIFINTLTNSEVANAARAGVLFEHVTAEANANSIHDCHLTSDDVSFFHQDSANVSGDTESLALVDGAALMPLGLNRRPVEMDKLVE